MFVLPRLLETRNERLGTRQFSKPEYRNTYIGLQVHHINILVIVGTQLLILGYF